MACLAPFGTESYIFQFAFQKYKYKNIQNYNLVCCFEWVWNLVSHILRKTKVAGAWERGADIDIEVSE